MPFALPAAISFHGAAVVHRPLRPGPLSGPAPAARTTASARAEAGAPPSRSRPRSPRPSSSPCLEASGTRAHRLPDAVELGAHVPQAVPLLLRPFLRRDLEQRLLLADEPLDAGEQAEVRRDVGPVAGHLDVANRHAEGGRPRAQDLQRGSLIT